MSLSAAAAPVCCEKTKSGNFCQYTDEADCQTGLRDLSHPGKGSYQLAPTSCDATSFCKPGCCSDESGDGFCYSNTPKANCQSSYNGKFSDQADCSSVSSCTEGCCLLGSQAFLSTSLRCQKEASKYPSINLDFRPDVKDEVGCVALAKSAEKGCCVNSPDDCKYVTRSACSAATGGNSTGFFAGKFCSDLGLGTCKCAPADKTSSGKDNTMCVTNDDSVYWKDSCGNPEGIKGPLCDYASGTLCGDSNKDGIYTCESVNCATGKDKLSLDFDSQAAASVVQNGVARNGESWCLYDAEIQPAGAKLTQDQQLSSVNGKNLRNLEYASHEPVGSRQYRGVCINGQELVEPCQDYRKEWCLQSTTSGGADLNLGSSGDKFTEAKCLTNRWQDCVNSCNTADPTKQKPGSADYAQAVQDDIKCCTDVSKRDCAWVGKCVPRVGPGFKTWENEGADTCAKASLACSFTVKCNGWRSIFKQCDGGWYPIDASGNKVDIKDVPCLKPEYLQSANNVCRSYGDCGADYNIAGQLTTDGFSSPPSLGAAFDSLTQDQKKESTSNYMKSITLSSTNAPDWSKGLDNYKFTVPPDEYNKWSDFFTGNNGWFIPNWIQTVNIAPAVIIGIVDYAFSTKVVAQTGLSYLSSWIGRSYFTPVSEELKKAALDASLQSYQQSIAEKIVETQIKEQGVTTLTIEGKNALTNDLVQRMAKEGTNEILQQAVSDTTTQQAIKGAAEKAGTKAFESTLASSPLATTVTVLNWVMWAYTVYTVVDTVFADTQPISVKTLCKPWVAPTASDTCEHCNPDYWKTKSGTPNNVNAFKACSEYRCKSLGANCQFINQGTGNETCVSTSKSDVQSPIITPWKEGFDADFQGSLQSVQQGLQVTKNFTVYTPVVLALQTDEPAQCKMSLNPAKAYKAMDELYFGGSIYQYFHKQPVFFASTKSVSDKGVELNGGGEQKIYVRCQDANGNANERDYVVKINVSPQPDATAPIIQGTSLGKEVYLNAHAGNSTAFSVSVNEPADCRWSFSPVRYTEMPTAQQCSTTGLPDVLGYTCSFAQQSALTFEKHVQAGDKIFAYIKCQDKSPAQNFNKDPYEMTFYGTKPLNLTSISPSGQIFTATTLPNLTLTVQTVDGAHLNGKALCKYTRRQSAATNVPAMDDFFQVTNGSTHTQTLKLSTGDHTFWVGCYDDAGNTAFANTTFSLLPVTSGPIVLKAYKQDKPPQLVVVISSDAQCQESITNPAFAFGEGNPLAKDGNVHTSLTVSDVYYVRCKDNYGNVGDVTTLNFI